MTCFGAGCFLPFDFNNFMTRCGNSFLSNVYISANVAVLTSCFTVNGAGRVYFRVVNKGVTGSGACLNVCFLFFAANGADLLSVSVICAGCGNFFCLAILVTYRKNGGVFILITADRAGVGCVTVFCAGGFRYGVNKFVTGSVNKTVFVAAAADRAGILFVAVCCAGGVNSFNYIVVRILFDGLVCSISSQFWHCIA